MGKLAVDEKGITSSRLFPNLKQDESKVLLFFISRKKKEDKVMIIHIMASCNFEGMKGKFLPSEYEEFFTEIFKNLEILLFNKGKKKVNVFESLKFEKDFVEYSFTDDFMKMGFF